MKAIAIAIFLVFASGCSDQTKAKKDIEPATEFDKAISRASEVVRKSEKATDILTGDQPNPFILVCKSAEVIDVKTELDLDQDNLKDQLYKFAVEILAAREVAELDDERKAVELYRQAFLAFNDALDLWQYRVKTRQKEITSNGQVDKVRAGLIPFRKDPKIKTWFGIDCERIPGIVERYDLPVVQDDKLGLDDVFWITGDPVQSILLQANRDKTAADNLLYR